MDAGGNITLLLPDFNGLKDELEKCQKEIEKFLLEKYHATLSIVMDYSITADIKRFGMGEYKALRTEISKRLNAQKSRKFKLAIEDVGYVLDSVPGSNVCTACGKHSAEDDEGLCILCEKQKELGQNIPVKNLMVLSSDNGDYEVLPECYLSLAEYLDYDSKEESIWALNDAFESYPVWRINNYTSGEDFEELAENAVGINGRGKPFLAYVKIDVDSLGRIINDGMRESEYSVSRFATLSRTLHHFFNMYVYSILEKDFPHSYTVLSGGDDLFLIMPWNSALPFVARLRNDFRVFCSNNSNFHFSAGVVLANRALDEEAKAEDGKNAVSFMGVTFPLYELDDFLSEYTTFRSYVQSDDEPDAPLSAGFVYRLYLYVEDMLCEKTDAVSLTRRYGTCSRIHYDIARNINKVKGKEEESSKAVKFILDKLVNYRCIKELEKFKLMIIQTLYENRTTNTEER